MGARDGMTPVIASASLAALLALVIWWDVRTMRIPDPLNLVIGAAGLAANAALGRDLWGPLMGAAAGYILIAGLNALYRRRRGRDGIGMGDAKFLAAAGAWVGWQGLPFVALGGALLGLAWALATHLKADARLPFGPFLAAGLMATWIATIA